MPRYRVLCDKPDRLTFPAEIKIETNYPKFCIVSSSEAAIETLRQRFLVEPYKTKDRTYRTLADIGGAAFAAVTARAASGRTRLLRVTFAAPTKKAWLKALEGLGAEVLDAEGSATVVIKVTSKKAVEAITNYTNVARVEEYGPDIKIGMALLESVQQPIRAATPKAIDELRNMTAGTRAVRAPRAGSIIPGCVQAVFLNSQLPAALFNKLTIVETPGGWHAMYRCRHICGNTQLAMWEKPQSLSQARCGHRDCTGFKSIGKGPRIETRGEGGYVVGDGSPLAVHASGLPYVHAWGPRLPNVVQIEPDERALLWKAASQFHCDVVRQSQRVRKAKQELKKEMFPERFKANADDPWVWYDVNGRPEELLTKAGWHSTDGRHWCRPGKQTGNSATLAPNEEGIEIVTVFSTSAGALAPSNGESHVSYGPFALLTKLEFGGDRTRAASFVRKELMRR